MWTERSRRTSIEPLQQCYSGDWGQSRSKLGGDDARDMNLPPINANLQHPSAMISMSTGNLVPSKAPCLCNLKTDESKRWQSLCNTCDIFYTCMTQHATLRHAYGAFNSRNSLVKRHSTLIECYVTSTTAHCTPQSSNRIGHNCNHDSASDLVGNTWPAIHQYGRLLYIYRCPLSFLKQTTAEQPSNTTHPIN